VGIGALLLRDFGLLDAIGGQEFGYRGGTENLPGALGFAAALEVGPNYWEDAEPLVPMTAFRDEVWNAGASIDVWSEGRAEWIVPVAMPGLSAVAQLIRFDQAGFAVSAGSACASGSLKPSRTLKALGVRDEVAARTIRVSFGWNTTAAEIDAFRDAWLEIAEEAKARA
jgi:cysteine desulfurase